MNIVKNTSFKVKSPYGYDDFKGVKKTTVPYYFKIILDDGSEFKGSEGHLVQLNEGSFFEISQLIEGDILSNGKTVVGVEGIEEELEVYDLLHVDNESSCYEDVNGIIHHNCAFINDIDEIFTSAQQTLACVYDNSIITTNKGLKRIKSLYDDPEEGFNPFYEGVYNINNDKVWSSHFYKSPKSKTLKITFDNGNYIICTQEHPILHRSGEWIKANDIKKGDTIKGYYNHNTHGDPIKYNYSHDMTNEDIAYCMGQWYLRGKSYYGVQFYKPSGDSALWYIDRGFFIMKKKYYTYKGDRAKDIIKVWKEAFNFKEEKKVSDVIMSASRSEYLAFLRGVLQSNPKSSHKNIILTFHSEQFVKDIQLMMMNIGIQTKIFRYSYKLYQLACSDESLELIKRIIYNEEVIDTTSKEYYCRVTNIEIGDTIETYDLKVPDGESFLSDGIINHNTGGKCIALSCVADDTYIRTNTGIKQMKSLIDYTRKDGEGYEINEYEVLGYGGSRKGNLIKNNGLVKTYILDTGYSKPLECSFNHKLWVYDNDTKEYRWKEAQHITKEDYLALNVGGDIWGNFESLEDFNNTLDTYKYRKEYNYQFPKITSDIAYLIGLWIAEGSSYANKTGSGNINISMSEHDFLKNLYNSIGIKHTDYLQNNVNTQLSSRYLLELWKYLGFDLNLKAPHKIIPEKILSFDRDNSISLLQGIFDGDGGITKKGRIYISLSSKELAYQINTILNNLGIISYVFKKDKDNLNKYYNKKGIKHTSDVYSLEIQEGEASKFRDIIGFRLDKKRERLNLIRDDLSNTKDKIPNSIELAKFLIKDVCKKRLKISKEKLIKEYKIYISQFHSKEYKGNISRRTLLRILSICKDKLTEEETHNIEKIISPNIKWIKIRDIKESKNYTYDLSLPDNGGFWDHSVIYNNLIGHQTPNGVGNWFHKTWQKAEIGDNSFVPIRLPWTVHPERDQSWRDQQDKDLGSRKAAQECDTVFESSGDTVFENVDIEWYEKNVLDPIERKGINNQLWVWEYPDYSRSYLLCADVSRGDGKDYSGFHVIDMETLTQVAEYKDQIGTREYGNLLVSVATEYNDALLIVENNNVGWDVVNTIIDRGYKNLYYSSKKDEISATDWMYRDTMSDMIPGFSVTSKNRPLIIAKLREYIEGRICIIRSKRLVDEMRVFIWKNGKAQAQDGYNDDLVMSYGTALYLRDNALRFREQTLNSTINNINSFSVERGNMNNPPSFMGGTHNRGNISWVMNVRGNEENINWLLE